MAAIDDANQLPVPVRTKVGDTCEVKDDVIDKLESFTCCLYGRPRFSKVDDLRYQMLKERFGDEVKCQS